MGQSKKTTSMGAIPWKEILAFLGVLLAAYIGYLGVRAQIEIPIQATQTAEARLAEVSGIINITQSAIMPSETLLPSPTIAEIPVPTFTTTTTSSPTLQLPKTPSTVFYIVQSGDTWQSISQKYSADLMILQVLNPGTLLSVGSTLYIPRFQEPRPPDRSPGSTNFTQDGTLLSNEAIPVPLHASKGQELSVKVTATGPVIMGVFNSAGWTIKQLDNTLVWNGVIHETDDYNIYIISSSDSVDYKLEGNLTSAPH